jgi:hypothetical protein
MSFSKTDELTEYFDYATVGTVSRLGDPSSTIEPFIPDWTSGVEM